MNNVPALSAYSNFSISHPHKSSFIVGTLSDNVDLHHLHNKGSIVSSDTHDFTADNLSKISNQRQDTRKRVFISILRSAFTMKECCRDVE